MTYNSAETGHLSIMKKLLDLKKGLSYLELEGQGRGIIMEVTRPLGKMAYHTKQIRRQCIHYRTIALLIQGQKFQFCPKRPNLQRKYKSFLEHSLFISLGSTCESNPRFLPTCFHSLGSFRNFQRVHVAICNLQNCFCSQCC